jgi:hypothetical protein
VFVSVSDNIAVFEAPAIAGIALLLAGWRRQSSQMEHATASDLNPETTRSMESSRGGG